MSSISMPVGVAVFGLVAGPLFVKGGWEGLLLCWLEDSDEDQGCFSFCAGAPFLGSYLGSVTSSSMSEKVATTTL